MPTVVVKVGTSTLLDSDERPSATFEHVARSLLTLRQSYDVVLVTSGAIGFGMRHLALTDRPGNVPALQALSMLGQVGLLERWRAAFGDVPIGQVLVTRRELHRAVDSRAFTGSIEALWAYGAIPVINENDAVSTEEISFGDNDRLAAEVAALLEAQYLVLLTDQDGIQADFGTDRQCRIEELSLREAMSHIVVGQKSGAGRGGASSKIIAAEHAVTHGVTTYIARASDSRATENALAGKVGTKIVQ